MGGAGKTTRAILNAAIFILMEVAALEMLGSHSTLQNFFLSKATHAFMAKVWGMGEDIRSYFILDRTNDTLAAENLELRSKLAAYEAAADGVAADMADAGFSHINAKIIKASRNRQHNYLILDKGSKDGVRPRTGVIGPRGVVGIVDAVEKNTCFVVSMMNTDLSVSARLGADGAVGPLRWDGTSSCGAVLEEISLQYKFAAGDTVYTSGHSSLFPAGIPLGTVRDSKIVNGATNDIRVDLLQDFSSLRWVSIVVNDNEAEMRRLESEEEGGKI